MEGGRKFLSMMIRDLSYSLDYRKTEWKGT